MTDGLGRRASLSPYAYSSSSPSSFPYIMGTGAGTPLDTYMRAALSVPNISFQRLETLDISSPLWPIDTALWVLGRCGELSGGALKEVGMTGRERTMEDVSALAKVLSGNQAPSWMGEDDLNPGGSPVSLASFDSFSFGSSSSSRSSMEGHGSPQEIGVKNGLMEDIVEADLDMTSNVVPSPPSTPKPKASTKRMSVTSLRLGLVTLSPEMLDMLAESLPGLQRLEVAVKSFRASCDDQGRSSSETYKPPRPVSDLQEVSEIDGPSSPPITPGAEYDLDYPEGGEGATVGPEQRQLNTFLGKLESHRGPRRWSAMQKLSILSDCLPRQEVSRQVEKEVGAWIGCPGVVRVNR